MVSVLLGCGGHEEAETVSGKVSYKGAFLPGGAITLVAANGKTYGGEISELGDFSISGVPTGTCKVMVNNSNLKMLDEMKRKDKGGLPPGAPADAKLPEGMPSMKGRYVAIPEKYKLAESTDLSVTVTKGQSDYPIELK